MISNLNKTYRLMRQAVRDFSKERHSRRNSVVHSMFFTEIKWEKKCTLCNNLYLYSKYLKTFSVTSNTISN